MTLQVIYIYSHTFGAIFTLFYNSNSLHTNTCLHAQTYTHFNDLLAHDHQRCLDLLLLLLYLTHHLQHGVSGRMALPWPGEEVEQVHL